MTDRRQQVGESQTPVRAQDKVMLRLPDGMRDRIKSLASKNNRSMNAEIVAQLEALEKVQILIDEVLKKELDNEAEIQRLKADLAEKDAWITSNEDSKEVVIDLLQALSDPSNQENRKYGQFRGIQFLSGVPVDEIGTLKGFESVQRSNDNEAFREHLETGIRNYTQESVDFLRGFLARHGWSVEPSETE